MKPTLFTLFLLLTLQPIQAQKTLVYLFPGQGSDERIFSKINLDSNFLMVHVAYPIPDRGTTMKEYAYTISQQIDTTGKFVLVGVSLGGMICAELADFLNPDKIIIISGAKCRKELPFRYRFQKAVPLNKIIPKRLIKIGALILQPVVEPDRKQCKPIFVSMLKSKSPAYFKRTVNMIINWDMLLCNDRIIHIHGTNDHTIPFRNVKADYVIENGSHVMTLTRGDEINGILVSILNERNE